MMNAALVVDDECLARSYMVELLTETRRFTSVVAVGTAADATTVLGSDDVNVEVVFIDIRLHDRARDTSGLQLARTVANDWQSTALVLATALKAHALDGFELGAVDYLLKPFTFERVQRCVERLENRIARPAPASRPSKLVARQGSSIVFLDPAGIQAFQAEQRLVHVHHERGSFDVDLSLSALDATFGDELLRVHRNWLVATSCVVRLEQDSGTLMLKLQSGLTVPVARDRARAVRERLLEHTVGLRTPR